MEHSWISSTARLWLLAIVFFAGSETVSARARTCPQPCVGEDCPAPPTCKYGTYRNNCGELLCAKGPSEICGTYYFRSHGMCAEGLLCKCGRCFGYHLGTMESYDDRICM